MLYYAEYPRLCSKGFPDSLQVAGVRGWRMGQEMASVPQILPVPRARGLRWFWGKERR
ncbi:unnamed protein product, partial [Nesidiocoris tenuis]